MDYINTNYISLSDLDDIDTKIAALGEQKTALSQQIQAKCSGQTSGPAHEVPAPVVELVQTISQLSATTSPETVEKLIEQNGNLAILTRILELIKSKQALVSQCAVLETGADVENEIAGLSAESSVPEYVKIAQKIKEIEAKDDKNVIGQSLSDQLRKVIESKRTALCSSLSSLLTDIKWLSPKEKVTIDSEKFKKISSLFSDLIELQASVFLPSYPDVWWGLDTLVSPFMVRFNFHFRDSAETNKLTKPEWALTYVEEFLNETLPTLEFVVGDTFVKHGRIGVFEIISAVLVPVRDKLKQMLAIINQQIAASHDDEKTTDQYGRLLSHLIFEATSFDQRLRNTYKYNPFVESLESTPEKKWMGLTGDILISSDKENVSVTNWLGLELRLAKKRFDTEIIAPKNAFDIDYEFTASSEAPESIVKPTYSAYGLAKLFDNLTSHFKTINIVKYQLKYVSQIQLVFLDQYLDQLQKQFRQFNESLGSKLISSFLASSTKNEATSATQTAVTNGLTGLEMLTGIYCSAKFIIERMEEWSENLIYIQLWNYCQSSSGAAGDSIFDSSIAEYKSLLSKVASKYEDFFRKEVRGALKDYVNASSWNIDDPQYKVQVSSSLSGFTTTLPAYASYLRRTLPEIDYFLVSSKICDSYAQILLEYVITNNQFNKVGLEQLQADIDYLYGVLKGDLMLDHSHKYSNAENKSYKKVTQSIEMMNRFDAAGAKMLKKQFQNGESVRRQFEHGLDCLSDRECLDLLFRII